MKKIFAFFLFVVMCLSTFLISAKDNNVLKYDGSEEVATDTIKNKKKKSVDEIEDEDVLMLEPSSLVIQTVPKKAKVYIDDELRGTTPLKIKNIVPDKYEIRIEKKGYEEIRETISIDGFRGKVMEIGIRSTKLLDAAGNIKIINHSNISTNINNITSGEIILINNTLTLSELILLINKVESQQLKIVPLSTLISEIN